MLYGMDWWPLFTRSIKLASPYVSTAEHDIVHALMALEGLACRTVSVSLRLARLPPLQAGCGAHVAYAPRLRLRQAFSCMLWSQNIKFDHII